MSVEQRHVNHSAPQTQTEFEMQVERLSLSVEEYVRSAELRRWCELNRERVYIPEWLLEKWGMTVAQIFSGVA